MKILAGVEQPDAGEIRLEGRTSKIGNVRDATRLGIALIHQELNLADNLDVGANVSLGREPRWLGLINKQRIHEDTRLAIARMVHKASELRQSGFGWRHGIYVHIVLYQVWMIVIIRVERLCVVRSNATPTGAITPRTFRHTQFMCPVHHTAV